MGVTAGVVAMGAVPGLGTARALAQYGQRRRTREQLRVPAGDRFELLGESLRGGTRVRFGVIESVLPVSAGAVPVVMRTPAGERFQVDVLRRDTKGPAGVAIIGSGLAGCAGLTDGDYRVVWAGQHLDNGDKCRWFGGPLEHPGLGLTVEARLEVATSRPNLSPAHPPSGEPIRIPNSAIDATRPRSKLDSPISACIAPVTGLIASLRFSAQR